MFIRKRDYGKCIQKVRINIGKEMGLDHDEDAYIVLKEIPTMEMLELKDNTEKGEKELIEYFRTLLPKIIVEHNLYEDENTLMKKEAVVDLIFERLDLSKKVMGDYTKSSLFFHQKKVEDK